MKIKVAVNTVDPTMGQLTLEDIWSTKVDYSDRDDIAHELINTIFDIYGNRDEALKYLSQYLDRNDISTLVECCDYHFQSPSF